MRIKSKLVAIFFLTSVLLVVAQVLVMQWSIGRGMIDYVNDRELKALDSVAKSFAELYQKDDSWQAIIGDHRLFRSIIDRGLIDTGFSDLKSRRPPPPHARTRPEFNSDRPQRSPPQRGRLVRPNGPPANIGDMPNNPDGPPIFEANYALLDPNKTLLAGMYPAQQDFSYIDIIVEEKTVGFLAVSKRDHLIAGYELNFVEQQRRYILFIALGLILVAMIIAIPLAAHFVKPIRRLTAAMSKLTSGNYQLRIDLKRKDEFAQLSRDFNELATTLEQNELARKRWLADISHELRTPVAVLKGEMESMLDGVRPLSLERIQSSSEEVVQLEKLLDDLHELTRSDLGTMHYRKDSLDLISLLHEEANHYQTLLSESGLAVKFTVFPSTAFIYADVKRLKQLFGNLFTNTVKYAGDGDTLQIKVELFKSTDEIRIQFEDNGVGVNDENLPKLFEHLFRVENSRNRETGGSGLGLSICKKIVEAHHGKISAFASNLGGLGILIILPME